MVRKDWEVRELKAKGRERAKVVAKGIKGGAGRVENKATSRGKWRVILRHRWIRKQMREKVRSRWGQEEWIGNWVLWIGRWLQEA